MNICALGSVLDSAQATVWSWRRLETGLHPAGGWVGLLLACWWRKAATSLHPPEPRRAAGMGRHTRSFQSWGTRVPPCTVRTEKAGAGPGVSTGTLHKERHPRLFPPHSALVTGICGHYWSSSLPLFQKVSCSLRLQDNPEIV